MRADERTPALLQQIWEGPTGLERVRAAVPLTVPDPGAFRAERRALVVDGVELTEWRLTPIAGAARIFGAAGPDAVKMMAVSSGVFRYWTGGRGYEGRAGSLHLLPAEPDTRISIPEPTRLLRIGLSKEFVPPGTRAGISATGGPIQPTRLTNGFVALVEQVMERTGGRVDSPAAHAVRSLATAVLGESGPEPEETDLRLRILDHIERHLGEQDLGPRSIAEAFDVSLRWVHRVFDVDGASIARHIRERRTDMVAAHLRSDHRWTRISALAARYGFAGRDQLTRAFKARYGMTVAAYADELAEGRSLPGPRPLGATESGDGAA